MEQKTNNMAFKMKGHTLPGINQRNGGKVDPDAPGTPGKPGYEPPVHAMDYLTKTPAGPVAKKKTDDSGTLGLHLERRGDALGAPTAGQMENTGDFNISNLHKDTKISLNKKKSPAKMYGKKSPAKNKTKSKVTTTRTSNSITKSNGKTSSTYNLDKSKTKKGKSGNVNYTFTNDIGNSINEDHGGSPAKIAPLVAMAGKAIIGGVVKKAMEKDSPAKTCGCGKKKCNC